MRTLLLWELEIQFATSNNLNNLYNFMVFALFRSFYTSLQNRDMYQDIWHCDSYTVIRHTLHQQLVGLVLINVCNGHAVVCPLAAHLNQRLY